MPEPEFHRKAEETLQDKVNTLRLYHEGIIEKEEVFYRLLDIGYTWKAAVEFVQEL